VIRTGLPRSIRDFQDAQSVHLADASPFHIYQQSAFLDHFPYARFNQVVALHFRRQGAAHVRRADHDSRLPRRCNGLARQVGDIDEARRHLVRRPLTHAVLQHGRERAAVKRVQILFFGQRAQKTAAYSVDDVKAISSSNSSRPLISMRRLSLIIKMRVIRDKEDGP